MGILSELRWVVGIHVAEKGLPPAIVAPVINILNEIDKDLTIIGYDYGPAVLTQVQRLKEAIVLLNSNVPTLASTNDIEEDDEDDLDTIFPSNEDDEDEDDDDLDDVLTDDEDDDD